MASSINGSRLGAPAEMLEKILLDIRHRQIMAAMRSASLGAMAFVISALAFFPSLQLFVSDIRHSDFFTFFSLLFSDSSVIMRFWQSFSLILLESFPAISFAVLLAVILILLQSVLSLSRNVKTVLKLRSN